MIASRPSGSYRRRKLVNHFMLSGGVLAAVLMIGVLIVILGYVVANGAQAIDLNLFTQLPAPAGESGGGMANAIVGSLIVLGLASAVALPIGLLTGVYLAEFSHARFAQAVRFVIETMAGVPSIVVGIFAFVLIVRPMGTFSAVSGGFALAVIMTPVFSRAAEEALLAVPFSLREASLALGVPVWRTVLRVVIPSAAPGIITAFMLALARAGGVTAPLLFTALGNRFWHDDLASPIATLPVQIWTYATGPYDDWHRQAWAGSLVLVGLILLIIGIVRVLYRGTRFRE